MTRHVPFTWPETAALCGCLACVFGAMWLILGALEAQRSAWAKENARHETCEFVGQCGLVSDDHYRRD